MISIERARRIVAKAMAAADQLLPMGPEPGAHPCDDDIRVTAAANDPAAHALLTELQELEDSERRDLLALIHIGRGDCDGWEQARRMAAQARATARHIASTPSLATYLEDALIDLGRMRPRYEVDRL